MAGANGHFPLFQHLGETAVAFAANAAIACGQFVTIISAVKRIERNGRAPGQSPERS